MQEADKKHRFMKENSEDVSHQTQNRNFWDFIVDFSEKMSPHDLKTILVVSANIGVFIYIFFTSTQVDGFNPAYHFSIIGFFSMEMIAATYLYHSE